MQKQITTGYKNVHKYNMNVYPDFVWSRESIKISGRIYKKNSFDITSPPTAGKNSDTISDVSFDLNYMLPGTLAFISAGISAQSDRMELII